MVLYYKASNGELDVLTTEEKKEEMKEEKREDIEEEPKKESRGELVSEPSDLIDMKSTEDEKEEGFEEFEDQEGLEASGDQEGKEEGSQDEEDEAAEENNPLQVSESKKVTAAKGWTQVGNGFLGSGAPVFRVTQPQDGLVQE